MEFESVLCEKIDRSGKRHGFSGVMFNKEFVLTSTSILNEFATDPSLQASCTFNVLYQNENNSALTSTKATIFKVVRADSLHISKHVLYNWRVVEDKPIELTDLSNMFFLSIEYARLDRFPELISEWYCHISADNIPIGRQMFISSTPFGYAPFFNTFTKGIICNKVGEESCILISDCATMPDTEGAAAFLTAKKPPFGVVIASSCWWRGNWTGLSLIFDLCCLFRQMLQLQIEYSKHSQLEATSYFDAQLNGCLVHVARQGARGSGVIYNLEKGIVVTAGHVTDSALTVTLFWKHLSFEGRVLFTNKGGAFDIAVIQSEQLGGCAGLKSARISNSDEKVGEPVFAAGYPLFSNNETYSVFLSKGRIQKINDSLLVTNCCVNSGMSGGGIFNKKAEFIGLIVCNTKMPHNNGTNPRFNMSLRIEHVDAILSDFINIGDLKVLDRLHCTDFEVKRMWRFNMLKL